MAIEEPENNFYEIVVSLPCTTIKSLDTTPWSYIHYKRQKPGKALYGKYVLELVKEAQQSKMTRNTNLRFHMGCGKFWWCTGTVVYVFTPSPELAGRKEFI